jgi:cobalt/nickel transport protein
MRLSLRLLVLLLVLGVVSQRADAHFHILLPENGATKRDAAVLVAYAWGHPFEHQLFNATAPSRFSLLTPDGKRVDLTDQLKKGRVDKEEASALYLRFTPDQRGDYVFSATCPHEWMEEDGEFFDDFVKAILHVQAQKGWDASAGLPFEMMPLTRPYGLKAGTVFQAQAIFDGKPLANALVEIERYNPQRPKELPPDEQITFTAKTDPNGVVTCTLPERGWWCITAQRSAGKRMHDGKEYPVRQRSTLWVFVDGSK